MTPSCGVCGNVGCQEARHAEWRTLVTCLAESSVLLAEFTWLDLDRLPAPPVVMRAVPLTPEAVLLSWRWSSPTRLVSWFLLMWLWLTFSVEVEGQLLACEMACVPLGPVVTTVVQPQARSIVLDDDLERLTPHYRWPSERARIRAAW